MYKSQLSYIASSYHVRVASITPLRSLAAVLELGVTTEGYSFRAEGTESTVEGWSYLLLRKHQAMGN